MPTSPAVVIIPARNEEPGIARVIADIPRDLVAEIIVVDNGSTDRTAARAREAGARVISQPERGYGAACLAGIAALPPGTEVVLFLDGDYSDDPAQVQDLLRALEQHRADLVLGSRTRGHPEPGSLTPQQRFGNWLSTAIIRLLYGHAYTDLGPFRAIRREALSKLDMQDRTYGWTVEMQVKAIRMKLRLAETPVDSLRRRSGRSKVGGTVRGVIGASTGILGTIFRLRCSRVPPFNRKRKTTHGNEGP